MGIVLVSSGIMPTNVMVAPNSPRLRLKHKILPIKIPGSAKGKLILKKTLIGLAPKEHPCVQVVDLSFERQSDGLHH